MRAIAVAILALAAFPALADEARMREGLAACFAGLPNFASVEGALTAKDWSSVAGAEPGERELSRGDAEAFVFPGNAYSAPGCTVKSATVSVREAEALLEAALDRGFSGKWKTAPGFDETKSWVVAGKGASLVMYVLGGGNSGDGPGSGVSLSVRGN